MLRQYRTSITNMNLNLNIVNIITNAKTVSIATRLYAFVSLITTPFGNDIHVQISDRDMGTCMPLQYANIFMADLEKCFLNFYLPKSLIYKRFIETLTHGNDLLIKFYHDFSNKHCTINLGFPQNVSHFLDNTVKLEVRL